jgi:hypothetical protein
MLKRPGRARTVASRLSTQSSQRPESARFCACDPIVNPVRGELKKIEPMDYRYPGSIFRGPLTGVTIGYHPNLRPRPRALRPAAVCAWGRGRTCPPTNLGMSARPESWSRWPMTARAGNRRFRLQSALRDHTKAPPRTDFL